jgi:transcriptional regulator with XRE-family HTH domain
MPRPETHPSIIREIRRVKGWTQSYLAELIGTTLTTIARIENGTLPLSRKLALRICWKTQVFYRDLIENKGGWPQTRHGNLTKNDASLLPPGMTPEQVEENLVANATWRAECVYKALKKVPEGQNKIWAMDAAIMEAFELVEKEFGISEVIDEMLGRRY